MSYTETVRGEVLAVVHCDELLATVNRPMIASCEKRTFVGSLPATIMGLYGDIIGLNSFYFYQKIILRTKI